MKGMINRLKKVNDDPNINDLIISKAVSILESYNFPNNLTQRRRFVRAVLAHRLRFGKRELNILLSEMQDRGLLEINCKGIKLNGEDDHD